METILTLESIEALRNSLYARGRSHQTVKAYSTDLMMFLDWVSKLPQKPTLTTSNLEALGAQWLNQYRRSIAPNTTGRRLTSLRAFGRIVGVENAFKEYTPPTPARTVPHPLSEGMEGVFQMIAACKNRQQVALIALCGLVGCRVSEALEVETKDFDLEHMQLTIRGKGDKSRVVPISAIAWVSLAAAVTQRFVEDGGGRILTYNERFARRTVTNIAVRAGLKNKVSSHDLRATFATHVHNKCRNLRVVQELLGHASSHTTEIYTQADMETMREAVALG